MTDWDERYRLGDTPWEKGRAAPPLLELLEKKGGELSGPVLVPGCGLGHDVRALAGAGWVAHGLDLSARAVAAARGWPTVGGETYELGDFLDPAWYQERQGAYGSIWEHTCFCAIDPARRDAYASAAAAVLVPGGLLAGVFYLTPYDPGEEESGPPFATRVEELRERFGEAFECIDGWVPENAYPGREGREWLGLFRRR